MVEEVLGYISRHVIKGIQEEIDTIEAFWFPPIWRTLSQTPPGGGHRLGAGARGLIRTYPIRIEHVLLRHSDKSIMLRRDLKTCITH